jgi:hypothetical protein
MLLLCCCAGPAQAALLLYDGFEYTVGQELAGQSNVAYGESWATTTTGVTPLSASGNLSVSGMPAPVGNMVAFDSNQTGITRINVPGAAITSGTTYWSAFLRVTDVGNLQNTGGGQLIGGFHNTQGDPVTSLGTAGAILAIRSDPTDQNAFVLGTGINTGGTNRVFSTTPLPE